MLSRVILKSLAIYFKSCHSESVKKFLIYIFSSLLFLFAFLFINPPINHASTATSCICDHPDNPNDGQNGFSCSYNSTTIHGFCRSVGIVCMDADRFTKGDLISIGSDIIEPYGIACVEEKKTVYNCRCLAPNQAPSSGKPGVNGIECNETGIDGTPDYFCNDSGLACIPDSNAISIVIDRLPGHVAAKGIRCGPPRAVDCKCNPNQRPRVKQNGFTCMYNGEQKIAWCRGIENVCTEQTGAIYSDYVTNHNDGEFPDGIQAVGIVCSKSPNYKPIEPPAPPCKAFDKDGKCTSIVSSIGDIDTEPGKFIVRLFGIMLAAAGAIALLIILRSGYNIMSARGNAEGIQKGREQIVSAIIGLMFLIFSFVLLQVITVDLLSIPGITK